MFQHIGSTFDTLYLLGNVTMNGVLRVNIDGTQSNACDVLKVGGYGNMVWNPGSSISVSIYNFELVTGNWGIIKEVGKGEFSGLDNITVTPDTLTLDGAAWAKGLGQLDS